MLYVKLSELFMFSKRSKKTNGELRFLFHLVAIVFVALSFMFHTSEVYAKKKRKGKKAKKTRFYNPERTRKEAILMIRANSEELSELIGTTTIDKNKIPKGTFTNQSEIEDVDELIDGDDDTNAIQMAEMEDNDSLEVLGSELLSSNNTVSVGEFDKTKQVIDYLSLYDNEKKIENKDIESKDEVSVDKNGDIIGDEGEDLEELSMYEEPAMSMEEFRNLWLSYVTEGEAKVSEETDGGIKKSDIMDVVMNWFGTPYRFGGTSENAIDCSAFVQAVFTSAAEIRLPRTAREQFTVGKVIRNRRDLKFGDLIFFNTRRQVRVSHVGIYLGDNLFAHASSRSGVTVSSLEQDYYNRKYIGAKRLGVETLNTLSRAERNN